MQSFDLCVPGISINGTFVPPSNHTVRIVYSLQFWMSHVVSWTPNGQCQWLAKNSYSSLHSYGTVSSSLLFVAWGVLCFMVMCTIKNGKDYLTNNHFTPLCFHIPLSKKIVHAVHFFSAALDSIPHFCKKQQHSKPDKQAISMWQSNPLLTPAGLFYSSTAWGQHIVLVTGSTYYFIIWKGLNCSCAIQINFCWYVHDWSIWILDIWCCLWLHAPKHVKE